MTRLGRAAEGLLRTAIALASQTAVASAAPAPAVPVAAPPERHRRPRSRRAKAPDESEMMGVDVVVVEQVAPMEEEQAAVAVEEPGHPVFLAVGGGRRPGGGGPGTPLERTEGVGAQVGGAHANPFSADAESRQVKQKVAKGRRPPDVVPRGRVSVEKDPTVQEIKEKILAEVLAERKKKFRVA